MSCRFFKSCGVAFLSVVLLYSSVAWAVEACLFQNEHVEHAASLNGQQHQHDIPLSNDAAAPDRPGVKLHCMDLQYQTELMPETSLSQWREFFGSIVVQGSPYLALPESSETRDLRLRALFANSSSSPIPSGLERHLFLSVFLI